MSAVIGWNNLVKTATLAANSEDLPIGNIATDSGSAADAWQTEAGDVTLATGALFSVTPAPASTWRVLGLFRTNLTSNAVVHFGLWNNGSPPTLVTDVTASPVDGYGQAVAVLPANTTADFLQVYIEDSSNPDNFINVPLAYAGPAWFPARSIGWSSTVGRDVSRADVITRGGQEYPSLNFRRRRWNVQLESLLTAEVWGSVDDLLLTADTGTNVLFAPDADGDYLQREAVFGRLSAMADVSFPYQSADRRRWSAQITERL